MWGPVVCHFSKPTAPRAELKVACHANSSASQTLLCAARMSASYHMIMATTRYDRTVQMLVLGSVGKGILSKGKRANVSGSHVVKSLTSKTMASSSSRAAPAPVPALESERRPADALARCPWPTASTSACTCRRDQTTARAQMFETHPSHARASTQP